jgi:hypothetical protein
MQIAINKTEPDEQVITKAPMVIQDQQKRTFRLKKRQNVLLGNFVENRTYQITGKMIH